MATNTRTVKPRFLVVYNYGQGGAWAYVRAASPEEIERRFPELKVVPNVPTWMSDELRLDLEERESYDIDETPRGLLADLLRQRKS